jgi:hypothetical protein
MTYDLIAWRGSLYRAPKILFALPTDFFPSCLPAFLPSCPSD